MQEIDLGEQVEPILSSAVGALGASVPGFQVAGTILANCVLSGSANAFLTLRVAMIARRYCGRPGRRAEVRRCDGRRRPRRRGTSAGSSPRAAPGSPGRSGKRPRTRSAAPSWASAATPGGGAAPIRGEGAEPGAGGPDRQVDPGSTPPAAGSPPLRFPRFARPGRPLPPRRDARLMVSRDSSPAIERARLAVILATIAISVVGVVPVLDGPVVGLADRPAPQPRRERDPRSRSASGTGTA